MGFEASEALKSELKMAQANLKSALDEADALKAEVETLKKSLADYVEQLKTPRPISVEEVIRIEQNAEDRLKAYFFDAFNLMVDEGEAAYYEERFKKRLQYVCLREEAKKAGMPPPELVVTSPESGEDGDEEEEEADDKAALVADAKSAEEPAKENTAK